MYDIEIAYLKNVIYDDKTGQLYLKMEVTDPVWKQKILHKWQELDIKIVIENKEKSDADI